VAAGDGGATLGGGVEAAHAARASATKQATARGATGKEGRREGARSTTHARDDSAFGMRAGSHKRARESKTGRLRSTSRHPVDPALRVAVFGGSFNPPHVGHVLACALLMAQGEVDRLLVVPTYEHPFAKPLAPYDDRVFMCELATGFMRGLEVSRVEEELGGESRTLRTLEHLARAHTAWKLRLVIGADILAETPKWFGFDAIVRLAPPLVLARAGVDLPGAGPPLLPDVSSTKVRAAIAQGAWAEVEPLVSRPVLAHIRARRLYDAPE
jgi:nicotinate-nucleotide adenylyltransferase